MQMLDVLVLQIQLHSKESFQVVLEERRKLSGKLLTMKRGRGDWRMEVSIFKLFRTPML